MYRKIFVTFGTFSAPGLPALSYSHWPESAEGFSRVKYRLVSGFHSTHLAGNEILSGQKRIPGYHYLSYIVFFFAAVRDNNINKCKSLYSFLEHIKKQNMEVHHHPDLHHKKKRFTDYLLEFMMIFLAVFMGFVAENIRESLGDKSKEKEYIASFIEDLSADTATLHEQIPLMKASRRGLDTLIAQTYLYLNGKADTRVMYYTYHHDCRAIFNLELSQRTIHQLKNSGNMRLIHYKEAADIISGAEVGFEVLNERTRFYKARQEDAAAFGLKIFDFKEYQKANTAEDGSINTDDEGFLVISYQPPLNIADPVYLKEFAARVGYYRNALDIYIGNLGSAIPDAEKAIAYLKKAYHL